MEPALSDGGSTTARDKRHREATATRWSKIVEYRPVRERLPEAPGVPQTTSFTGGAEGYLTAGTYDDGRLGALPQVRAKARPSPVSPDAFSIAISVALQCGVPLRTYVEPTNMRFRASPALTDDPDIRMAQSSWTSVFRRLALDHLDFDTRLFMGITLPLERARQLGPGRMPRSTPTPSPTRFRRTDRVPVAGRRRVVSVVTATHSRTSTPTRSESGQAHSSAREVTSDITPSRDPPRPASRAQEPPTRRCCMTCGTADSARWLLPHVWRGLRVDLRLQPSAVDSISCIAGSLVRRAATQRCTTAVGTHAR